jgi:hypothetical protein
VYILFFSIPRNKALAERVSQQILTDEYERTSAWPTNNRGLGI